MVPGFNGVMDVMVVANPMAREGILTRKVVPSLLLGLGALSPWLVRAVARGVIAASHFLWGMSVGEVHIGSSIIWDSQESVAWRRDAELLACCSRAC